MSQSIIEEKAIPSDKYQEDNLPIPANFIESLRSTGYGNDTALLDIVDNSVEWGSSEIHIDFFSEKEKREGRGRKKSILTAIRISDNGVGMSRYKLDQAFRFGSDRFTREKTMGKYGMGMKTSAISIGKLLEVISKDSAGKYIYSRQDIDVIKQQNKFVKILEDASSEQSDYFENVLQKFNKQGSTTGTILTIRNIDRWKHNDIDNFAKELSHKMGRAYRRKLNSNLVIYINGKKVKKVDPITDNDGETLIDKTIDYKGCEIHVKIAKIGHYSITENKSRGIGISTQGFSVLRNDREIQFGETFKLWARHSYKNRFRGEFSYSDDLDEALGSDFMKSKTNLPEDLKHELSKLVAPCMKLITEGEKKRVKANRKAKTDDVEKTIMAKSDEIDFKPGEKEKRNYPENRKPPTPKELDEKEKNKSGRGRLDVKYTKPSLSAFNLKFDEYDGEPKGPLYRVEPLVGSKIQIWLNQNHPFYSGVIHPLSSDPNMKLALYGMIFAQANAELKSSEKSLSIIEDMKYDVGRTLATIMSN